MTRFINHASSALRSNGDGAEVRLFTREFRGISAAKIARVDSPAERQACSRELSTAADRSTTEQLNLALLWRELIGGSCKVVDGYFTVDRCLLLTRPSSGPPVPLSPQRQRILEAVLVGGAQKVVAIDFAVSPSTIASQAQLALQELGLHDRPSRAHPLLVRAAKAEREGDSSVKAWVSFVTQGDARTRVLSVPRPEQAFANTLSCAEFAVVQCLVEGECYARIAERRGTSQRTVANQIASVFRRLHVSGRAQLLLRLFANQG